MTRLSVNINKFATLRNSRGGNNPDVVKAAMDAERFGAQGITVHPRPDERHIRYQDVIDLRKIVRTEFNIEGYPDERYLALVEEIRPAQATLVPDSPDQVTSNAGWDTIRRQEMLLPIIRKIKSLGVRVSLFVNADERMVEGAAGLGSDRIELYTEPYASAYKNDRNAAIRPYIQCSELASKLGLGVNAGHDLSLQNLRFFKDNLPFLDEVSIGHALVCDSLYFGFENTIQLYLRQLK
jgi:pyridoxine 5-phosphate synthase